MSEVQNIYHTGFAVNNLDKSLDFYTRVLGMKIELEPVISETPWISAVVGYKNVKIRQAWVGVGGGHFIELNEYVNPRASVRSDQFDRNRPGSTHVAMVVEDVIEWRQKLAAEGIKTLGPDYERDVEWPRARYAIYFQDPDGNWLEMVSRDSKPEDSKANNIMKR